VMAAASAKGVGVKRWFSGIFRTGENSSIS
jgi:hypothetical protein